MFQAMLQKGEHITVIVMPRNLPYEKLLKHFFSLQCWDEEWEFGAAAVSAEKQGVIDITFCGISYFFRIAV